MTQTVNPEKSLARDLYDRRSRAIWSFNDAQRMLTTAGGDIKHVFGLTQTMRHIRHLTEVDLKKGGRKELPLRRLFGSQEGADAFIDLERRVHAADSLYWLERVDTDRQKVASGKTQFAGEERSFYDFLDYSRNAARHVDRPMAVSREVELLTPLIGAEDAQRYGKLRTFLPAFYVDESLEHARMLLETRDRSDSDSLLPVMELLKRTAEIARRYDIWNLERVPQYEGEVRERVAAFRARVSEVGEHYRPHAPSSALYRKYEALRGEAGTAKAALPPGRRGHRVARAVRLVVAQS